jgi:hypothetical protein
VASPGPRGVIQHSGLQQGGVAGYGGQVVGPQYGAVPQRPAMPQQQSVWPRPGQPQQPGQQQRMVRPVGPQQQHLGPMRHSAPQQQQYAIQQPPAQLAPGGPQGQAAKDNIAYNVEHVFMDENGREVRKMPVEIEGETIWVECVPGGGQARGQVTDSYSTL